MTTARPWLGGWRTPRARAWVVTLVHLALLVASGLASRAAGERYRELLQAPWVAHPDSGHCYALVGPRLSWDDASAIAESWGGHLACLETAAENAWLTAHLLQVPSDGVWVGGREGGREGAWQWVNGAPWDHTNWGEVEPNNTDRTDNLLVLNRDGRWNDADPNDWHPEDPKPRFYGLVERERHPADPREPLLWQLLAGRGLTLLLAIGLVVRASRWLGVGQRLVWFGDSPGWRDGLRGTLGPVPPRGWLLGGAVAALLLLGRGYHQARHPQEHEPWVRSPVTGRWYALLPANWSWSEVRARALALGGDLAVVPNAAESEWIADTLCGGPGPYAYLGLREVAGNGRWEWVDGSPPTFVYQRPGLPLDLQADPAPNNVVFLWGWHDQRRFDPRDQFGERHGCWETTTDPLVDGVPDELRPAYGLVQRSTSPYWPTPARLAAAVTLLLAGCLLAALAARARRLADPAP